MIHFCDHFNSRNFRVFFPSCFKYNEKVQLFWISCLSPCLFNLSWLFMNCSKRFFLDWLQLSVAKILNFFDVLLDHRGFKISAVKRCNQCNCQNLILLSGKSVVSLRIYTLSIRFIWCAISQKATREKHLGKIAMINQLKRDYKKTYPDGQMSRNTAIRINKHFFADFGRIQTVDFT